MSLLYHGCYRSNHGIKYIYPRFSIEQTRECLARFARSPIIHNWRASATLSGLFNWESRIYTRIMVTIKKRAGVIFPIVFSSSIALLSSLLSCRFYLLDPRTISRVDILEMTWKDGKAYRRLTTMCVVNKLL